MSYQNYLQRINTSTAEDNSLSQLVEDKKSVFYNRLDESLKGYGDLALGLWTGSSAMKGAHGLYKKWRKKKGLESAADDVKDPIDNPLTSATEDVSRQSLSWTRRLAETGKEIGTTIKSATGKLVKPALDITSQVEDRLPADFTPADYTPPKLADMPTLARRVAPKIAPGMEDVPTLEPTITPRVAPTRAKRPWSERTPQEQAESMPSAPKTPSAEIVRPAPATEDIKDIFTTPTEELLARPGMAEAVAEKPAYKLDIADLRSRVSAQKLAHPEYYEPQFEGPVAPRGFGQKVTSTSRRVESRASQFRRGLSNVKPAEAEPVARPLEPAVARGQKSFTTMSRAEKQAYRLKQDIKPFDPETTDFKYKPVSKGRMDYERGFSTNESNAYADSRGLIRKSALPSVQAEPQWEVSEAVTKTLPSGDVVTTQRGRLLMTGGGERREIRGAVDRSVGSDMGQPQGRNLADAFMGERSLGGRPLPDPMSAFQKPQPPRPVKVPTDVTEGEPAVAPSVPKPTIAPKPTKSIVLSDEPKTSVGGETTSAVKTAIPKTAEDLSTDVGTDVGLSLGEVVPVAGELLGLGVGLYDIVRAFAHHKEPAVKRGLTTGIADIPTQVGGSGYV